MRATRCGSWVAVDDDPQPETAVMPGVGNRRSMAHRRSPSYSVSTPVDQLLSCAALVIRG